MEQEKPISLSEWLIETMKVDEEFRKLIMSNATELDKEVYNLHQFEDNR